VSDDDQTASEVGNSEVAIHLGEVIRGLVDEPDEVFVEEDDLGHTVLLRVQTDPDELGKVIGRQGRTVRALRALLEVRAAADDAYYDIEIVE
jgi:predicted RNA-binding protein YlqC (UPF0109 family)